MLFDHDAKVSGDSARFADLLGGWAGVCAPEGGGRPGLPRHGHESGNLRAEMTALSALAPATVSETGLVLQDNEDAAYGGRWLFAIADGLGGHTAGMGPR